MTYWILIQFSNTPHNSFLKFSHLTEFISLFRCLKFFTALWIILGDLLDRSEPEYQWAWEILVILVLLIDESLKSQRKYFLLKLWPNYYNFKRDILQHYWNTKLYKIFNFKRLSTNWFIQFLFKTIEKHKFYLVDIFKI